MLSWQGNENEEHKRKGKDNGSIRSSRGCGECFAGSCCGWEGFVEGRGNISPNPPKVGILRRWGSRHIGRGLSGCDEPLLWVIYPKGAKAPFLSSLQIDVSRYPIRVYVKTAPQIVVSRYVSRTYVNSALQLSCQKNGIEKNMPKKNWHENCTVKKSFWKSKLDLLIRFSLCGYCGVREEHNTKGFTMSWFNVLDGKSIEDSDMRQAYNLALSYFEGVIDDDWIDAESNAIEDLIDSGFPYVLAVAIAEQAASYRFNPEALPRSSDTVFRDKVYTEKRQVW